MVSVSRVDPATLTITHTATLPNRGHGSGGFDVGRSRIVVGDGAVWAIDPDDTVARIDPRSGRVVTTIKASAGMLAAGAEGVWVLSDEGIARIDPATNRLGTRIPLAFGNARDIAVGGGAVWVTDEPPRAAVADRRRAQPDRAHDRRRRRRVLRRLRCGRGLGRQLRHRERCRASTRARTASPHGSRSAPSSRWRSATACRLGQHRGRRPRPGRCPRPACSPIDSGGRTPDVLIASDLPLHGQDFAASSRADVDAIRLVLQQHGYRAGRFNVGYQSCDESTVQNGTFDPRRCAANANAYAHDTSLVALIGPFSSFCAEAALRTLNLADGGPVPVISPTAPTPG